MTCMGNSGPLATALEQEIAETIDAPSRFSRAIAISRAACIRRAREFPGVAAAGRGLRYRRHDTQRSRRTSLLGQDRDGKPVYLREIWPDRGEKCGDIVADAISPALLSPALRRDRARHAGMACARRADRHHFRVAAASTFIRRPPFFEDMRASPPSRARDIRGARVLGLFGDMLTTDHISPIGAISQGTPAAHYLQSLGIAAPRLRELRGAAPQPRRDDPRHVRQYPHSQRNDAGVGRQLHALPAAPTSAMTIYDAAAALPQ